MSSSTAPSSETLSGLDRAHLFDMRQPTLSAYLQDLRKAYEQRHANARWRVPTKGKAGAGHRPERFTLALSRDMNVSETTAKRLLNGLPARLSTLRKPLERSEPMEEGGGSVPLVSDALDHFASEAVADEPGLTAADLRLRCIARFGNRVTVPMPSVEAFARMVRNTPCEG